MTYDWQIEPGDTVTMCFGTRDEDGMINGIVRSLPQATGDSWIIETEKRIYYVQNFGCIFKEKP